MPFFFDHGCDSVAQQRIGDTNKPPWLHQADTGSLVGGDEQAFQYTGVNRIWEKMPHVAAFGDYAIDGGTFAITVAVAIAHDITDQSPSVPEYRRGRRA